MNGFVSRVGILIAFSFGPENLLSKTGGMREYHSGPRLMHFVLHWIPDYATPTRQLVLQARPPDSWRAG